jgi:hypothetical protein
MTDKVKQAVFRWFDAHKLTSSEVQDLDYLLNLFSNFEEEFGEFDDDEVGSLICDYQIYFMKK